jgi:hypothetical protein
LGKNKWANGNYSSQSFSSTFSPIRNAQFIHAIPKRIGAHAQEFSRAARPVNFATGFVQNPLYVLPDRVVQIVGGGLPLLHSLPSGRYGRIDMLKGERTMRMKDDFAFHHVG